MNDKDPIVFVILTRYPSGVEVEKSLMYTIFYCGSPQFCGIVMLSLLQLFVLNSFGKIRK